MPLRTVSAIRYVEPLREGGSLPGLIECDDGALYVTKFRAAGQGEKALVAEVIGGELARHLELDVPELVLVDLDPVLGRTEMDPEIQALLRGSGGLNLGVRWLPGALAFDPALGGVDGELASRVVWLDALITNVDRTARNTNLLWWHKRLHLIDHGASLVFHHSPSTVDKSRAPFPQIRDHVLLPFADALERLDNRLAEMLTEQTRNEVVELVPAAWLDEREGGRARYLEHLQRRLQSPRHFVEEAAHARAQLV